MEKPAVRYTEGHRRRVSTPSFPECGRMDDFYAEAHRLIEAQFDAAVDRHPRCVCASDFAITQDGDDTLVTLRLRMRENGRVVAKKSVVHRWRDGYIAPPKRTLPLSNIISKYREKHKRKVENGRNGERDK